MPLLGGAGVAVDYTLLMRAESALQNAADGAALASAKELGITNTKGDAIKEVARTYVYSNLMQNLRLNQKQNSLKIDTLITKDKTGLTVDVEYYWAPFLLHYLGNNVLPIKVSATANLAGIGKVCMIGLDQNKKDTIHLTKRAGLEAPNCGIYSNSSNKSSIRVQHSAKIVAGVICSAGGIRGTRRASFLPKPLTDCPIIKDPLADRIAPPIGSCDFNRFRVRKGEHTLYPGTYCKGLKVTGTAKVKLMPGIYVINGDKLEVTNKAVFEGENVGFYLSGDKAKLVFRKQTTINLTAPKGGLMAGLLIFEDRNASRIEKHQITSDNARMLLGTIYLPNGTLKIDSEALIADKAAYTAIIARSIKLFEGPTLYLNSNYEATDVPVPDGLGGENVHLVK